MPGTLVFFDSPRRVAETLADLHAVLGDRQAALARELTKRYETVRRGSLGQLAAELAAEEPPRGEIVVLVAPPGAREAAPTTDVDAQLEIALRRHSVKDAASLVAAQTGQPRRKVYARAIELGATLASDEP